MILDLEDRKSPTWAKLKAALNARLMDLRVKNDSTLTEIETARLRGRIAEIQLILDEKDGL